MKTSLLNSRTGVLAAALAAAIVAGPASAEDEGVVRLGRAADGQVARGQSDAQPLPSQAKPGLLQVLSASDTDAADDCGPYCAPLGDGCCSELCCPDSCCADSCCPMDGCDGCGYGACGNGRCCSRCTCANCGAGGCGSGFGCGAGYGRGSGFGFGGGGCGCGCSSCGGGGFLARHCAAHNARRAANNARLCQYLRCKLGYFIPDGCGGVGCKPFGCYSIVYPDNPGYFDGRDGQVYAAQGIGGPVSVPVAPNVRHAYNYGWGIPSSRLTPISNAPY